MTIAVTGEWGTGKSSLMNLLKGDLCRYGFRPVWFNAWHHQKEEHHLLLCRKAFTCKPCRSGGVPAV
ncbi:MAG: P-loop NTPase fold protein [Pyrinomonadaceae bacterium]